MAASFRSAGEVRELAGCDRITIAPALLAELEAATEPLPRKLSPEAAAHIWPECDARMAPLSAAAFDRLHSADQMAVEKLAEARGGGFWGGVLQGGLRGR
jgi:transaldolase